MDMHLDPIILSGYSMNEVGGVTTIRTNHGEVWMTVDGPLPQAKALVEVYCAAFKSGVQAGKSERSAEFNRLLHAGAALLGTGPAYLPEVDKVVRMRGGESMGRGRGTIG
jgi:hypothetical protein